MLALLEGEISSRSTNDVRSLDSRRAQGNGFAGMNVVGRARTPSLVPRPYGPGTGPPITGAQSRGQAALSLPARA